jgi:hypothetical protein
MSLTILYATEGKDENYDRLARTDNLNSYIEYWKKTKDLAHMALKFKKVSGG